MIIKLEQRAEQKNIEVLITYPEKNENVERIVSYLKSIDTQIECYSEDEIKFINVSDIYYIESVDKTAVVFCDKESYRTKFRLFQLYDKLADKGFVQISKYCILNINQLEKIKPLFNSCMEAILSNGAHLHVTRKYLADIKRILLEDDND
jgi:DNA-binding LytR/AlgR family response regulator